MGMDFEGITFKPPFHERGDSALFDIVGDEEQWQPFARALAEAELRKRGFSQDVIDQSKQEQARQIAASNEAHQQEMLRRPKERYTVHEALLTFITWVPFIMVEHMSLGFVDLTGKGLWTLSAEKRWLKFWLRCGLILASVTLYAFILTHFVIDQ